MGIVGFILLVILIIGVYINAPRILDTSKDNPKVKAVRTIQILFLIVIIGRIILPFLGIDKLFSSEINNKISVGIIAIIIMYFGNVLPKIPIYKNMEIKNPWAVGDEKVWRRATKVFAYLSFIIAIIMFVSSFYFYSVAFITICQVTWFGIPLVYLLIYYNKKFKYTKIK